VTTASSIFLGLIPLVVAVPAVAWAESDDGVPVPFAPAPPNAATADYQPPPGYKLVPESMVPNPVDPGAHKHDGFFMRALLGIGATSMTGDLAVGSLRLSGVAMTEDFAFGAAISENLILYGEYALEFMMEGQPSGAGKAPLANRAMAVTLTFAPGVAYYFGPSNMYVAGAGGLAMVMVTEANDTDRKLAEHDSSPGLGGNLMVGKEWWVSDNWGLGIAGRAAYARTREKVTNAQWSSASFAVLFSATYN
jgi:hypothetical protein